MDKLVPVDEMRRLQKRMNKLLDEMGLSELQSRTMDEIERIQDKMSRLLEEVEKEPSLPSADVLTPLSDIIETEDELIVKMDLPSMEKGDVEVTISDDILSVKASRKALKEEKEKDYYRRERTYSKFERSLKLPCAVKDEEASAKLENGTLQITLPKEVTSSKKKIEIK